MKCGARNRIHAKVKSIKKDEEIELAIKAIHVLPVKE